MTTESPRIQSLLEQLRAARSDAAALRNTVQASAARLRDGGSYRHALQTELQALLQGTQATHALTEAGLLSDETIIEGVLRRVAERVAPAPPRDGSLELALRERLGRKDRAWLSQIDLEDATAWTEALMSGHDSWEEPSELASALVILATRVAGAGVDARLSERVPSLEAWSSPFLELSRTVDGFAERLVKNDDSGHGCDEALAAVEQCVTQVARFREQKKQLGTTLRLSSASLRTLQQLQRLRLLLECTLPARRARAAAMLGLHLCRESCRARPTIHFVEQKLELLAYLAIGHAAQKGAKYAVHNAAEYRGFWFRGVLGGFIVAIFAALKLHISHEALAPVPQALIYGANYALCFVLISIFGATLATKQPALTASRLAGSLQSGDDRASFPELVRAIWRSQFVSFLGNIGGAAAFAALLAYGFSHFVGYDLISQGEGRELASKLHPLESGTLVYAAIAGVMLSLAGFFAGFIDNAVVFHRVSDRVRAGSGIFRWLGSWLCQRLATRVERSAGVISGNVALGFMLGSAGAFGEIMGVPFDIRHVAFASSHSMLAIWHAPELVSLEAVGLLFTAVSLIGFINFVVSFSITLSVAVNARKLEGVDWRAQFRALGAMVNRRPMSFFFPIGSSSANRAP